MHVKPKGNSLYADSFVVRTVRLLNFLTFTLISDMLHRYVSTATKIKKLALERQSVFLANSVAKSKTIGILLLSNVFPLYGQGFAFTPKLGYLLQGVS